MTPEDSSTSKRKPKKPKELLEVSNEQLDLLENHTTEALSRIWTRARTIVFARNRKKREQELKRKVPPELRDSEAVPVKINRLALQQIHQLTSDRRLSKKNGRQLLNVLCTGRCGLCAFGIEDLNEKWHCALEQTGAKITVSHKFRSESTNSNKE